MSRVIFSVWFFLYFIPPLFFFGMGYNFELLQLFVINLSFLLGFFAAYLITFPQKKYIDYSCFFRVKISIIYIVFFIYFTGKYQSLFLLVDSLLNGRFFEVALNNAVQRYENHESVAHQSILSRLATIALLMSGFLMAAAQKRTYLLWFLFFLMIVVESMALARFGVLIVIVTFVVEYSIRHNAIIQDYSFFKLLKIASVLLLLLFAVFLFSAYGRVHDKDGITDILIYKLGVYTVAMYQALLEWMSQVNLYGTDYGTNIFAGVYKIFGFQTKQGFYSFSYTIFGQTNIYTNMRGLLSDFGFSFTCLFFFTVGFFVNYYSKNLMNKFSYLLIRFLLFFFIFILFSPFIHFNTFAAFIISWVLIVGVRYARQRLI